MLAAAVVAATAITAVVMQNGNAATGTVAARVGGQVVTASAVQREVAVIESQPAYQRVLSGAQTVALAAPINLKSVAASDGDPDDLRVSFSPAGGSGLRPYTVADVTAGVLTRLIYVAALRDLIAMKHVTPTQSEVADARQEAELESGLDATGKYLFDDLPRWYQNELVQRGADLEALTRALIGSGGITQADIEASYRERLGSDYTTVCLKSVVVAPSDVGAGRAELAGNGKGVRDDGCAPLADWASDVAAAVHNSPAGTSGASVQRGDQVALLEVTNRIEYPLSAVLADVRAGLYAQYSDLVDNVVEDELGLLDVSVAPQYGTYENLGTTHDVLPPDALTPPSQPSTTPSHPTSPSPPQTSPPQQHDPFD
jgi:hypothetical protein